MARVWQVLLLVLAIAAAGLCVEDTRRESLKRKLDGGAGDADFRAIALERIRKIGGFRAAAAQRGMWEGLPEGPYRRSCSGCALWRGELSCTCRDARGQATRVAAAAGGCAAFDNVDGQLVCANRAEL
eukprot:m51a1_g11890 hypothetical protein (128) ;mRNA; r:593678-594061